MPKSGNGLVPMGTVPLFVCAMAVSSAVAEDGPSKSTPAVRFVDRDGRAPDGHSVARPVQAEHHVTAVLSTGHTGRRHRVADQRQAKNAHNSHEDRVRVACGHSGPNITRRPAEMLGARGVPLPFPRKTATHGGGALIPCSPKLGAKLGTSGFSHLVRVYFAR